MYLKKSAADRKSQVNIEFIGGLFLFLLAVTYVAFSIISGIPSYQEGVTDSVERLAAWSASGNFLRATESGGTLDDAKLANFTDCYGYNYNDAASRQNYIRVRSILGVGESQSINILLDQFPVAVFGAGNTSFRSGTIRVSGSDFTLGVRNTTSVFNEVRVSAGSWVPAGGIVDFSGSGYTVARIDYSGDFAIFKKAVLDCGPSPLAVRLSQNLSSQVEQTEVRRYSTYGGHIARITLTLW